MNERTPVSAYRLLSSPCDKSIVFVSSRRSPCMVEKIFSQRSYIWCHDIWCHNDVILISYFFFILTWFSFLILSSYFMCSTFLGSVLPPYEVLCVCVCVISQLFSNIAWHRTTSYDVAGRILMSPIDCWRNSTLFRCKASLCTTKIDNYRTLNRPTWLK